MSIAPGMVSAGPAHSPSSSPVAALPMYDWPCLRAANDRLWRRLAQAFRARGFAAPEKLERTRPEADIWRDPGLLIAQTCGYPLVAGLFDHVRLVATPCYGVTGCSGAYYSSQIVVRRESSADRLADVAGMVAAINNCGSQSGLGALYAACMAAGEPRPFFGGAVVAGSHLESMRAVAAGESDVAAIDAVCWALACREYPDLTNRLRSLGTTAPTPGLPLVTAAGRSSAEIALIREALSECLADPQTEEARRALFITGFDVLGEEDYRAAIALLDAEAMARLTPAIA